MRPDDRRPLTPRERAREKRRKQIQRRRLVAGGALLVLIVLIIVLAATCGGSDRVTITTTTGDNGTPGPSTTSTTLGAATYIAELSGSQAVPPVDTEATGTLLLSYDPDKDSITFSLGVDSLTDPSVAAIFEGAEGEEGAAVVTLFAGPAKKGSFTGTLAEGTITADDLTGSLEGATLADLIALINDGRAYVSIGSVQHPAEAIRGVITAE